MSSSSLLKKCFFWFVPSFLDGVMIRLFAAAWRQLLLDIDSNGLRSSWSGAFDFLDVIDVNSGHVLYFGYVRWFDKYSWLFFGRFRYRFPLICLNRIIWRCERMLSFDESSTALTFHQNRNFSNSHINEIFLAYFPLFCILNKLSKNYYICILKSIQLYFYGKRKQLKNMSTLHSL